MFGMRRRNHLTPGQWCYVAIIAGIFLVGYEGYSLFKVHQCQSWQTTSGTVTQSELIRRRSGRRGYSYEFFVEYEYFAFGEKKKCNTVSYGDVKVFGGLDHDRDLLERYRVGTTVDVHFNPADTGEAVLESDAPQSAYIAVVVGAVLCLGGAVALFLINSATNAIGAGSTGTYSSSTENLTTPTAPTPEEQASHQDAVAAWKQQNGIGV